MQYQPLEANNLSSLGVAAPTFKPGDTTPFFATSSFLYTLCFTAIVIAAFYRYTVAGILRMQASEAAIRKSNEIIRNVTLGLLGVFSLFLILFTVNKDLVRGDVDLRAVLAEGKGAGGSLISQKTKQSTGSTSSPSCESTQSVLTKLQSEGGICTGTTCTILSGCNYQQYNSIINQAVGGDIDLRKRVIVTMCRESRAKPNAERINGDGTYDCGLMQIHQNGPCNKNQTTADQEANIYAGVKKIRETLQTAANYPLVPGVPQKGSAFASYNCCGDGTKPASQSNDCTPANGFPENFPKWACPINPGTSDRNMCTVKNYACELTACLEQL